ncbi:hypothetical protein V8D89_016001 [Ganoderma adspersum]
MNQKPLALAAVGYSDGLRAFIHSGDGKIHVVGNEAEVNDILSSNNSKNYKKGEWEPGTLRASCSAESNLAAFEGQDGLVLGLLCQLPDATLALYRRDYKWRPVSDFTGIQKARPGTALAAVSSRSARKVVLFFQDQKSYVCSLRATWKESNWRWEDPVRLAEAAPGCGIAATSWKRDAELEEIGLYYQDANLQTVELRLSFSACGPSVRIAPLQPSPLRENSGPVCMKVLAAASWGSPNIRLYLRDKNGNIREFQHFQGTERRWRGQLITLRDFTPRSNLAALARTYKDSDKVVIDLLYWSADKTLNHKLFVHGRGWQHTTFLGPPPIITPPESADPHDVAFSDNAIRFEALPDLIGIRDALWTLGNHARWLTMKTLECALLDTFSEIASEGSELLFDSEPPQRIVQHIVTLADLVARLSRLPAGDNQARSDILQQCKAQAGRLEETIGCWPAMCEALRSSFKLAERDVDSISLVDVEDLVARVDAIREVMSSTLDRAAKMLAEQKRKVVAAETRLEAAIQARDAAQETAEEMRAFRLLTRVATFGLTMFAEYATGFNDDLKKYCDRAQAADRDASRYLKEKEEALEEGKKMVLGLVLVTKQRDDLELDKLQILVRLNSADGGRRREQVVASKTRAERTVKFFSALQAQSKTLPLQSSAQGFAKAILDILEVFDGPDVPDIFRTHRRRFRDLRRQLGSIPQ